MSSVPERTQMVPTTSENVTPVAALVDYESGVSNGDVDWLFRGKASKKLAKKKPDVGVTLNFNKQIINGNGKTADQQQQQSPKSADSKLTEQLRQEKQKQEQVKKSEPLKPALVNSTTIEPNTRARSTSDSGKLLVERGRIASDSKTRSLQRRSSEATYLPSSSQISTLASAQLPSTSPGSKKNLLSSISSKFTKPPSTASSPASSPLQPATSGNLITTTLNINQPKKPASASYAASSTPPEQKGLFGIRRKLSVSKPNPVLSATLKTSSASSSQSRRGSVTTQRQEQQHTSSKDHLERDDLSKTKLKRVTFALDSLEDDPQQQIPSRNPKRGNVLVPEDILAEPARLSIGISDSNNTIQSSKKQAALDKDVLALAYESQRVALMESLKHAQEAHLAAQRMAREVSSFKVNKNSKGKEDNGDAEESNYVHTPSNLQNIDNPLHHHIDYFANPQPDLSEQQQLNNDTTKQVEDDEENHTPKDIPLDVIYTRCCHLREILPIPATLKQLKNKSKPLTVLKMLNPKPTLIDILSFSDFLAITPIVTIIFDNVTIDTEMLKIVLSSISNSLVLEKLSLRNVAIDSGGWKYLCKFLTLSKSLIKLDISQQKIKADTPKSMHRSEMNWDLFNQSLIQRGGIEELVINGCKLTDRQFNNLISNGVSLSTRRLGVASTNLNVTKCESLANWITKKESTCMGIDIAFNDMSNNQLRPFINTFKESTKLAFFSLNSTNVSIQDCEDMIKVLSKLKSLRFLDLSNIPHCFPAIISTLAEWLPKFQDLRRIHFELDELTAPELVAIANILPECKNLIHVSFLGHKDMNYATAVALYGAIKLSSIYTLDIDYDLISEDLSSKIALYLMINMEKSMNKDLNFEYQRTDEELMADGSLITQAVEKMFENDTSVEPLTKKSEELYSKEIITKALVEKTTRVRKDVHKQMDKLFELRMRGQLSLEGKETLIRFCLLDNSLEKVVNIFEEQEKQSQNAATLPVVANPDCSEEHLHKVSSDILESGPIVSPNLPMNAHQNSYFPALQRQQPTNTEHPHMVVADSNKEGEDIPIDQSTGRPVLFRKLSHTSEHAKKQEEEEGEFHKWGFFMQQQDSLFPSSIGQRISDNSGVSNSQPGPQIQQQPVALQQQLQLQLQLLQQQQQQQQQQQLQLQTVPKKLNILPSGPELREAIIKSKGLQKVNDLIDKFNIDHNRNIQIEDLYNTLAIDKDIQQQQSANVDDDLNATQERKNSDSLEAKRSSPLVFNNPEILEPHSPLSINSFELDEAYDKLLNEVDKVRSNKT